MEKQFAIDIGTNSIRLLYAQIEGDKLRTVEKNCEHSAHRGRRECQRDAL